MLATIPSATVLGVDGHPVRVEVHVADAIPGFTVVGLPDTSCREARDRVRAALLSSGMDWPKKKITVNLAPTTVRKIGSGLDLAVAVGVLVATRALTERMVEDRAFIAELGLDGSLRSVAGVVPLTDAVAQPELVVAVEAAPEAALVGRHKIRPVANLRELVAALSDQEPWPNHPPPSAPPSDPPPPDLAHVRGQPVARRALELAAAGGHHLLLVGPPGAGKTMLARRLPGLLPTLSSEAAIEATRIHSAAGIRLPAAGLVRRPPFRAPHHSATMVSLVGGGTAAMRPGEISIATGGVLFLDELGEFHGDVLESLRQPLEEGVVRVTRARAAVSFPAKFLLVAATNPCPCGEGGPPGGPCRCSEAARARYRRRLSAPLLDRFDLRVDVTRPSVTDLLSAGPGEPTEVVARRVAAARERAQARGVVANGRLSADDTEAHTPLTASASRLLEVALRSARLSARGLARVRRLALTIADLADAAPPLSADHVGLALELRGQPSLGGPR